MQTGKTARGFNYTAICPHLDCTAERVPKRVFRDMRFLSTVYLKAAIRDFKATWGRDSKFKVPKILLLLYSHIKTLEKKR